MLATGGAGANWLCIGAGIPTLTIGWGEGGGGGGELDVTGGSLFVLAVRVNS